MLVEWRPLARAQLSEILEYISDRNLVAASELYKNIEAAISALPQHPYLYRFGRVPGTREIVVHPNYLVVYSCLTLLSNCQASAKPQRRKEREITCTKPLTMCGALCAHCFLQDDSLNSPAGWP